MANLTIPDRTFADLARRASAAGLTVEQLVLPLLEQMAPPEPTPDERRRALDEWDARIRSRADRYPPGFRVDDSRETIYFGNEGAPG
jgi:hypothetical protein